MNKIYLTFTLVTAFTSIALAVYLMIKQNIITKTKFNNLLFALIISIIGNVIFAYLNNWFIEPNKPLQLILNDTLKPFSDTLKHFTNDKVDYLTTDKVDYLTTEDMGGNLYKIGYDGTIFGYLKLPTEIDMITLYSMEGNTPKEGSTVIMEDSNGEEINMINRELFLKKLGSYINTANINKRKLIISAHGEKTQWYAANLIKFGKDPKKLNYLKQVNMWHPVVNKVIQMQGWINYPQ